MAGRDLALVGPAGPRLARAGESLAPELRGFAPEGHGARRSAHLVHRSAGTTLSGSEIAFSVLLTETEVGARVEFDRAYGVESTGLGCGELCAATISGDAQSVRVRVPYELRTGD